MAEGFFWQNDPNVNSQLRQRIALAMMASRKGYPKNIGEGLSAIGNAIGNIGIARKLEDLDRAQQDQARQLLGVPAPPDVPQSRPYVSSADDTANTSPVMPQATLRGLGSPPGQAGAQAAGASDGDAPAALSAEDGGYNVLDAQAGMKRTTPGYIRDAIARNIANPDMQAYLGSLAAGEAKGPNDVSPTGAAGPFQFVPGTARQYGLADPTNLDASVQAAQRLTADNAATFQKMNGRPPTMAELAVMHQQGGATGARMVSGTGNASPRNLALNNVNPGASPAQAASAIKGYYGMPDRVIDTGVAAPQSVPTAPQQTFPAAPDPGYVTPAPGRVPMVQSEPMTPRESRLNSLIAQNPGNPYFATMAAPELKQLSDERALRQTQQLKTFESDLQTRRDMAGKRADQLANQAERVNANTNAQLETVKRQQEINKAQDEAQMRQRFQNLPPEQVIKELQESKVSADSARNALIAANNIRDAVNGGAIFGAGADFKLSMAKIVKGLGGQDKGNLVANTEVFQSQIAPMVAQILKATVGTNQISENDRRFAQNAAGGNINLDEKSVRKIIDFIGRNSRYVMEQHDKKVGVLFGNEPGSVGRTFYGVEIPQFPEGKPLVPQDMTRNDSEAIKWARANSDDPRAAEILRRNGVH